ncbi:MAG: ABC-type transport auxiliary lipoprotein family protein [Candidatus Devosia euplotis]|nr:ABC-type transport auxiliary lipoprotein family protein [Candidatus Devosia euplotis]
MPPVTFDLTSAAKIPMRRRSSRVAAITLPVTVQTYDTQRVVVCDAGNVLSYLPDAQLSDTLLRLVQTRLLQTFQASSFPNIGRSDDQLSVDVTLATELQAFEIDASAGNLATVTINAKLVDEWRSMIFASKNFTATQPHNRASSSRHWRARYYPASGHVRNPAMDRPDRLTRSTGTKRPDSRARPSHFAALEVIPPPRALAVRRGNRHRSTSGSHLPA